MFTKPNHYDTIRQNEGVTNMELRTLGEKIRKHRKIKGLRQENLAEMCELSTNYIGMIERGEKVPSLESFINIANALEVSADILLSDILKKGYTVKESVLAEKLENLPAKEKQKIYDVIETLLEHR